MKWFFLYNLLAKPQPLFRSCVFKACIKVFDTGTKFLFCSVLNKQTKKKKSTVLQGAFIFNYLSLTVRQFGTSGWILPHCPLDDVTPLFIDVYL